MSRSKVSQWEREVDHGRPSHPPMFLIMLYPMVLWSYYTAKYGPFANRIIHTELLLHRLAWNRSVKHASHGCLAVFVDACGF